MIPVQAFTKDELKNIFRVFYQHTAMVTQLIQAGAPEGEVVQKHSEKKFDLKRDLRQALRSKNAVEAVQEAFVEEVNNSLERHKRDFRVS